MPSTYPKSLPHLILEFGSSIRHASRSQAHELLLLKPKSLLGSEMIFEIATSLQEILDNTWLDPDQTLALDAERNAKDVALASAEEQHRQEEELQARHAEEQLLQELANQRESRSVKRPVAAKPPQSLTIGDEGPSKHSDTVRFDRNSSVKLSNGRELTLQAVRGKLQYRQGPVCYLYCVQPIPTKFDDASAPDHPLLLLKECYIPLDDRKDMSIKQSVQNLESRLQLQLDLGAHSNIMKPLNYSIQRSPETEPFTRGWTISVLMELAERGSLRETLDIVDKLDVKLIRAWSIQIVEGLQHYHRHGIAHADVHPGNILLQRDREAERGNRRITIAKLSDGGYQRDLHNLKSGWVQSAHKPTWIAPEIVNSRASSNFIPATDIWDFGCCFLQMAFGLEVVHEYQSPKSLLDGLKMTSSVRSLLSQIFQDVPKERPSAWDLLHFEFFRLDDGLLVSDLDAPTSLAVSTPNLFASNSAHTHRESVHGVGSSRYVREFTEDGRLGRGGFGEVFRVRNKIDGQPYAVKKVKACSRAALDPVLSEVTVLSRLNHPNVVRYFASWIEDGVSIDLDSESSDGYTSSITNGGGTTSALLLSSRGLDFISSNNTQVVFADDDSDSDSSGESDDDIERQANNGSNGYEIGAINDKGVGDGEAVVRPSPERALTSHKQTEWTILYIQMEYCKPEVRRFAVGRQGSSVMRSLESVITGSLVCFPIRNQLLAIKFSCQWPMTFCLRALPSV